jgi:hypothetical protein
MLSRLISRFPFAYVCNGTASRIVLTFLSYPFPLVEPLAPVDGLRMVSVKEIGATKAYTIGRRGTYKDHVDLYFIIAKHHVSLGEIIVMAERKFRHEFNSRPLRSNCFMNDVWDYEIDFLKRRVAADEMTDFFRDKIRTVPYRIRVRRKSNRYKASLCLASSMPVRSNNSRYIRIKRVTAPTFFAFKKLRFWVVLYPEEPELTPPRVPESLGSGNEKTAPKDAVGCIMDAQPVRQNGNPLPDVARFL